MEKQSVTEILKMPLEEVAVYGDFVNSLIDNTNENNIDETIQQLDISFDPKERSLFKLGFLAKLIISSKNERLRNKGLELLYRVYMYRKHPGYRKWVNRRLENIQKLFTVMQIGIPLLTTMFILILLI